MGAERRILESIIRAAEAQRAAEQAKLMAWVVLIVLIIAAVAICSYLTYWHDKHKAMFDSVERESLTEAQQYEYERMRITLRGPLNVLRHADLAKINIWRRRQDADNRAQGPRPTEDQEWELSE